MASDAGCLAVSPIPAGCGTRSLPAATVSSTSPAAVQVLLVKIVTGVMQMEESSLALAQPRHEVGMDSIMGLEIVAGVEKAFGLRLSAMDLAIGPSIERLAETVLRGLADIAGVASGELAA
jgi:acyl carrier protein